MYRSAVRHTSTSVVVSDDSTRTVSLAAVCGMAPRKTRAPSSLQKSGERSLTTHPSGKPAAVVSRTTGARLGSASEARTSGITRSTLSRSLIWGTSFPFRTAMPVPASFHASRA